MNAAQSPLSSILVISLAAFTAAPAASQKGKGHEVPVEVEKRAGMMLDRVQAERDRNQKTYERDYLPRQKQLQKKHRGKWLAIVSGKLVPAERDGTPAPAAKLDALDAELRKAFPRARHRFVIRIGDEGKQRWGLGMSNRRFTFGRLFLRPIADNYMVSYGGNAKIYIVKDKKRSALPQSAPGSDLTVEIREAVAAVAALSTKQADGAAIERIERRKRAPARVAPVTQGLLFTNLCEGTVLLGAEKLASLEPALWELPGSIRVDGLSRFGKLRRVWLRFRIPGTPHDFIQHAALWPAPDAKDVQKEVRRPKLPGGGK